MYLETSFVIAPAISSSLLIGTQDMDFINDIPQLLSTNLINTDIMSITADQHFTGTSILEQVINSYTDILINYT